MQFDTFIIEKELPIEIYVEYSRYGATRGYRNSIGVPEEPDEDAGIEIEKVIVKIFGVEIPNDKIGDFFDNEIIAYLEG